MDNLDDYSLRKRKSNLPRVSPCIIPEGFRNISIGDSQLAKSIRGYIKKRGFNPRPVFKIWVSAMEQWARLTGYLIIPFYYQGQLKYYNARNVIGKGSQVLIIPIKISQALANNLSSLIMTHWKCTGRYSFAREALNALTMGDRGIATMGKAISQYQINELLKSQCERYIILLDPDAQAICNQFGAQTCCL